MPGGVDTRCDELAPVPRVGVEGGSFLLEATGDEARGGGVDTVGPLARSACGPGCGCDPPA